MSKILYAAADTENAKLQLARFVSAMKDKPHQLKVAAYKKSSPSINIDWTLDCLLNIFKPQNISVENENFSFYFDQVKKFNPDLIISDLEYFTSYIANNLNIPLWQCSSALLNNALSHGQKYNLGLYKNYYHLFRRIDRDSNQREINMIDNSESNFVYSHFGDTLDPPILNDKFEWIRPYHFRSKPSALCKHNIVAGMFHNNKKLFKLLENYDDCVVFSEFLEEEYPNILLKDIYNLNEYSCNVANSDLCISDGTTSFLADAFYNNKFSIIIQNIYDIESIINGVYSEKLGLSKIVKDLNSDLTEVVKDIDSKYNRKIKYLHEKIEEKL